ncbi:MAG TPA: hypothetical protein EYP90_10570, partial [Chromatiaceae bacterium]|nr:hypothetical protein [Chromatiaceae bacterium]
MKTSLFPILSLLVVTLWLSGCSTSPSRMKSHLGMTVTPPPEDALPDALLEYEKRNWGYQEEPSGWLERKTWQQFVEDQRTYVQQVFTASRKPYVLGFARQQAANRPDWRQLRKTTLDLTNVGMHLFGGGATLAPLWTLALDVDTFVLAKSREGKMMRMPSLTLYVPYPDLASLPVDEAMVAATNDLGERLVRTGLCRYLTAPHQGTYGS